jgi:ACS family hexuronate transporter-like MFS transporter
MLLGTALAPMMPSPTLATAAICWSFFWTVAMSVNIYSLPLDYFGAERAAFGVSALTGAYGILQTVLSPLVGHLVAHYGFVPVCAGIASMPLLSYAILRWTGRE